MPLDPILPADALSSLSDVLLFDCRPSPEAYAAGHLQGAIHARLEHDLAAPTDDPREGGRHPLPAVDALCRRLGAWGVTPASHVVAYDDQGGANAAARFWWMLRALGHAQVQVIDGGLPALLVAGHRLTTEPATPASAPPYPARGYALPLASRADVERARTDPDQCVLDVRAAFRYRGESEPLDPIAGHIVGAQNLPFSENLRGDGTFKSADALRAQYTELLAGRAPAALTVHCGSGVTACHTLLALERAGLAGAKLYVGSWSEWCRHPELARAP